MFHGLTRIKLKEKRAFYMTTDRKEKVTKCVYRGCPVVTFKVSTMSCCEILKSELIVLFFFFFFVTYRTLCVV